MINNANMSSSNVVVRANLNNDLISSFVRMKFILLF